MGPDTSQLNYTTTSPGKLQLAAVQELEVYRKTILAFTPLLEDGSPEKERNHCQSEVRFGNSLRFLRKS